MSDGLLAALQVIAREDPDRLREALRAAGATLDAEVAARAAAAVQEALVAGDLEQAERAVALAAAVHVERVEFDAAVAAQVRWADIKKARADTADELDLARDSALRTARLAHRLRAPEHEFGARVVAADCAYFAGRACEQQRDIHAAKRWLLTATADCLDVVPLLGAGHGEARFDAFVGLLVALGRELLSTPWFDSDDAADRTRVRDALRTFALALETWIPVELPATMPVTDVLQYAGDMAELSYRHGSPDVARARLAHADARAAAADDVVARIDIASIRYHGERESVRTGGDLREQRSQLIDLLEARRAGFRSRAGRILAAQVADTVTTDVAADEFADPRVHVLHAWRAVEANRARVLLDELDGCHHPPVDDVRAALLGGETAILHLPANEAHRAADDEFRLQSRLPVGGLGGGFGDARDAPERRAAVAELETAYAAGDCGFVGAGRIAALDEIGAALAPGEALLSYHIPYHPLIPAQTLLILLVRPEGAVSWHVPLEQDGTGGVIGRLQVDGKQPLDASPLGQLVAMTRLGIQEAGAEVDAGLEQLHRILVAPTEEVGFRPDACERLVIVPHGVLHAVPFAALRDEAGTFLVEKVPLVIAPSGSVWSRLAQRATAALSRPGPPSFLGLGNPTLAADLAADFGPLEHAGDEVSGIVERLDGLDGLDARALLDDDATEAAFRALAPGRTILHLAAHGDFPEEDAMDLHRVLLAAGDGDDGRLHAEEVRGLDLSAAELVVLSVCDGALFRFGPGDEPMGLVPAFMVAGATNVLGPLWAVDDEWAAQFMLRFYDGLPGSGPAEALQHTMVSLIGEGADVRDWAGFALFGAGRPFFATA